MIDGEQIVAQVVAAFPSEPLPPKEALLNPHCCECVEVSEAFGYKPWPTVTLEDLRAGGETALLTAIAWRYYLPAVITWCIRAPEVVDVIQDNLVYQLRRFSAISPGTGSVRKRNTIRWRWTRRSTSTGLWRTGLPAGPDNNRLERTAHDYRHGCPLRWPGGPSLQRWGLSGHSAE
jgi:hypothetical protein